MSIMKSDSAEEKNTAKKSLKGTVTIAKNPEADCESNYLTFKCWTRGDQKRIYINDYKGRTLGYIEGSNTFIKDRQGNTQEEIEYAINSFNEQYTY